MDGTGLLGGAEGTEADALEGEQAGASGGELPQHLAPYIRGHDIVHIIIILDEIGDVQHIEEPVIVGHNGGVVDSHLHSAGDDLVHNLTVGAHGPHVDIHNGSTVRPSLHTFFKGGSQHVEVAEFIALRGSQLDDQRVFRGVFTEV